MAATTQHPTSASGAPREDFVSTAAGKAHYLEWPGNGPQAHLLHANGFCAGIYAPMVDYFKAHLHLFASDIRGHGDSDFVPSPRIRHWRVFADDLMQVVEGALRPPVIGIGHSLGAVSTYIAAAAYPHLFRVIILLDPVILTPWTLRAMGLVRWMGLGGRLPLAKGARRRKKTFADKERALRRFTAGRGIFKSWSTDFIEAYLECGLLEKDDQTAELKCDPELEAQIFEAAPLDVWRYAQRITCPLLAMRGQHSQAFPAKAAARLKHLVPDCEIQTLPDSGHFFPMEKPALCAEAILAFLRRRGFIAPR